MLPEEPQSSPDLGTGEILREGEGERVALVGYGTGVQQGRSRRLSCSPRAAWRSTVADARFAKPLDGGLMAQLAAEHDLLVTVEEGVLAGGFGSAVWETLNRRRPDGCRASCASAFPTATSPTASRRCCTTRSATPGSGSRSAS